MHRIEDVVAQGMCIGCGACSVATRGAIPVTIGTRQSYVASLENVSETDRRRGSRVCPFSDESKNEDQIAQEVFPTVPEHDPQLGKFTSVRAGRIADEGRLVGSSSGGMTSWLVTKLLAAGDVDGVIHVGTDEGGEALFGYQVSYTNEDLINNRKSMYYSTTFAEAVNSIRGDGKRYAFVGVPCFVRAARLLADGDAQLGQQLLYFVGLVCGHLKSFGFAEAMAWQTGVSPRRLGGVDFRVKDATSTAASYRFGAREVGAAELITLPTSELVGGNWGHGMFQLNACNYCDDIFAETADVAFGDAWLPQYESDWRGTNVVVSRNARIDEVLEQAYSTGELEIEPLSVVDAVSSQSGNFRHRHLGLSVRLGDDIARGVSVPKKRIAPNSLKVTAARVRIIRLRRRLSVLSQDAFVEARQADSLGIFLDMMRPLVKEYRRAELQAMGLRRVMYKALSKLGRQLRRSTR